MTLFSFFYLLILKIPIKTTHNIIPIYTIITGNPKNKINPKDCISVKDINSDE